MYIINELRLREQEIEVIKNKIEELKRNIEKNKEREDFFKLTVNSIILKISVSSIIVMLYELFIGINNMELVTDSDIIKILLKCLFEVAIVSSVPTVIQYLKYKKYNNKVIELTNELEKNEELLVTKVNYLNELKNKSNENENEYTNYKYKIINNSDSLIETKTSSKTRIRKKDK